MKLVWIIIIVLCLLMFGLIKVDAEGQMQLTMFTRSMCEACHEMEEYLDSKGAEFKVEDIGDNGAARSFVQNRLGGRVTVPMLWDGDNTRSLVGFSETLVDEFLEAAEWEQGTRSTRRR